MNASLTRLLLALAAAAFTAAPAVLHAADTDIYINQDPPESAQPLVMFSLDYRSNLTSVVCTNVAAAACTQAAFFRTAGLGADLPTSGRLVFFDVLRLALKLVLSEVSGVRVGLMLNHDHTANQAGPDVNDGVTVGRRGSANGGYIAMGFREIVTGDANGTVAAFSAILNAMKLRQDAVPTAQHPYQGKELFFEFFRYLRGLRIYNGHNGYSDYSNPNNPGPTGAGVPAPDRNQVLNLNLAFPAMDWAAPIEALDTTTGCGGKNQPPCKGRYIAPTMGECAKIFTINFLFQVSNQEDDSDAAITQSDANGGMGGINLSGSNNKFSTVIEYMNDRDMNTTVDGIQNVQSYFIVSPNQINNTTTGYASAGGTGSPIAMAENPEQLVRDLRNIFDQILSVSTTFVAASVPVNVFNRATVVDNVYIALFQADDQSRPFWAGNLKKLKLEEVTLADDTTDVRLVDANGDDAIATDGRIQFDALTFWTDPDALTDANAAENISVGLDGRHVARGGAGQKIPGYLTNNPQPANADSGARKIFYDSGSASLSALDATTTLAAALRTQLGAATDAEALSILKYIRGQDANDQKDADANLTEARAWMLGDPLHSRPFPINYGDAISGYSEANPAIFIAMGANDGMMRLFRNTNPDGTQSGAEVWAFMPTAAMGIQKRLYLNAPDTNPATLHPYGVDGAPTVYQDDDGSAYLFFGLRRGGRAYYGMNITDPLNPSLMWTITNATSGFAELGQSFSTPQIGMVRVGSTAAVPALFFGGGYDADKDYKTPNGADDTGRALYVVNALTGALIWKAETGTTTSSYPNDATPGVFTHADMQDSIPSEVTIADTNGDGFIDRVVVGDTGGNLWRADTRGTLNLWSMVRLANLGYHYSTAAVDDRRFFHAPDVVLSSDSVGAFDAVLIGSGDRENPLDRIVSARPQNFFYLIKDRRVFPQRGRPSGGAEPAPKNHGGLTDISTNACLLAGGSPASCSVNVNAGWKLSLSEGAGEKALSTATTFSNVVFFTTYLPPDGTDDLTCGPQEGSGALYAINLDDGSAAFNFDRSDDDPDDTSGNANSAGDRTDPLASGGIPAQVVFIPIGDGGLSYIRPDLDVDRPPGSNRFSSFWQREE